MHAIAAMKRDEPHWLMNEADSKRYAVALGNALRHLPIKTTQKAVDFGAFLFCVFEMETPRITASIMLAKARQRPQRPAAAVYPLRPGGGAGSPPEAPQHEAPLGSQ